MKCHLYVHAYIAYAFSYIYSYTNVWEGMNAQVCIWQWVWYNKNADIHTYTSPRTLLYLHRHSIVQTQYTKNIHTIWLPPTHQSRPPAQSQRAAGKTRIRALSHICWRSTLCGSLDVERAALFTHFVKRDLCICQKKRINMKRNLHWGRWCGAPCHKRPINLWNETMNLSKRPMDLSKETNKYEKRPAVGSMIRRSTSQETYKPFKRDQWIYQKRHTNMKSDLHWGRQSGVTCQKRPMNLYKETNESIKRDLWIY